MAKYFYPEWAMFCQGRPGLERLSPHRVGTWLKGATRPAITQAASVAAALGASESEVIAAAGHGPYATQAEALEAREERQRQAKIARYANDQAYRAKIRARPRKSTARSPHRAMLRAMTTEERKAYECDHRRAYKLANRDRDNWQRSAASRPWGLGRIRQEMASMRAALRRCEHALSVEWMPWHTHGCWTMEAWAQRAPQAHAEYRRKLWQVRTQTRRAKEAQADGHGVTLPEWRAIMQAWGYRCAYCGKHRKEVRDLTRRMDLEVEHVVPLPIGPNRGFNIVPACKPCNTSKAGRDVEDWALWKGLTLDPRVLVIHRLVLGKRETA